MFMFAMTQSSSARTCLLTPQEMLAHSAGLSEQHCVHTERKSTMAALDARLVDSSAEGMNCLLRSLFVGAAARHPAEDLAGLAHFPDEGYQVGRRCVRQLAEAAVSGVLKTGFAQRILDQVGHVRLHMFIAVR